MKHNDSKLEASAKQTHTANNTTIGRAFRRSLVVIVTVLLVAVVSIYAVNRLKNADEEFIEQTVVGPKVREEPTKVEIPKVRFKEITQQANIDFVHINGAYGNKLLPETMGGGVAFLDYDDDGDQDLLLVNSTYWPDQAPNNRPLPILALYQNDGTGSFNNVTKSVGLDITLYGMGVAVGDYDNDGYTDVYITAVGKNYLFHNDHGVFRDVTESAGVAGDTSDWSTGAAFIDYDNDGDLDLFVANYVRWSKEIDFGIDFKLTGIGRAYGPPTTFAGSHPVLYRNQGHGKFEDVSAQSGVQVNNPATNLPMGKALGITPIDVDQDGWIDVLVANDTIQNFFLHNQGDGTFKEEGVSFGVAFDRNGSATGAMGTDAAYYRNDLDLGFAVGNFANEMTSLYVTQGEPTQFADEAIGDGIGPASRRALTFGLFFFDYDLDGRLELLQANGHLEDEINVVQPSQHYAQPAQIFWNCGPDCPTTFIEVPSSDTSDLAEPVVGRGASFADIDNDGDLDVIITQVGRSPRLLRNDQQLGHHWLRVKLIGRSVNRDAIGSWIEISTQGLTQRRQVMPTRSYLSQVELPVTFGLANAERIDSLQILWSDGSKQEIMDAPLDSTLIIEQQEVSASG